MKIDPLDDNQTDLKPLAKSRKVIFADQPPSPYSPATQHSESAKRILSKLGIGEKIDEGTLKELKMDKLNESK